MFKSRSLYFFSSVRYNRTNFITKDFKNILQLHDVNKEDCKVFLDHFGPKKYFEMKLPLKHCKLQSDDFKLFCMKPSIYTSRIHMYSDSGLFLGINYGLPDEYPVLFDLVEPSEWKTIDNKSFDILVLSSLFKCDYNKTKDMLKTNTLGSIIVSKNKTMCINLQNHILHGYTFNYILNNIFHDHVAIKLYDKFIDIPKGTIRCGSMYSFHPRKNEGHRILIVHKNTLNRYKNFKLVKFLDDSYVYFPFNVPLAIYLPSNLTNASCSEPYVTSVITNEIIAYDP